MIEKFGPQVPFCAELHSDKYRLPNESFEEYADRFSAATSDDEAHRKALIPITLHQRYMGGGRSQAAMGSPRNVTAFNCFVSPTIEDSMDSIMQSATSAAETMRRGGGIGFDFSRIRPHGDRIVSLDSSASGPVSFMHIFDAVCETIVSAGHRRGAMMAVLRVDHPDIERFIRSKKDQNTLTNFNISVGVTDEFMKCVDTGEPFTLQFEGRQYDTINAKELWNEIMRNTWDWAEPGVIFLDRINSENPLWYCETIAATNPCGEQPLPPNGACLLGSFNLVKYVNNGRFDFDGFKDDIPYIVRATDNIIDRTNYPIPEQAEESRLKRRMGLGFTALANALTLIGREYGTPESYRFARKVAKTLCLTAYETSIAIAKDKGPFPLFDADKYLEGGFIKSLPVDIKDGIRKHGIRNSHLTSIAPTGTISFTADNVSGAIEPVFAHELNRTVQTPHGAVVVPLKDYVWNYYGMKGVTSDELTTDQHLQMQIAVQPYIDSAISKTINVGDKVTFDEFNDIYMKAWKQGLKGVTTFRLAGKRFGILNAIDTEEAAPPDGAACFIDPETGTKECS